jgi:pyruvate/2-oxoglutarate dehydrogenase complex dihydrolipoamide acyltransferase (E2) component
MSTEVRVPDLGDGIDSGDVLDVLVSEGDQIEKEQGILELETDKATVEVPSTVAGKVIKVHVEAGQSIGPGDVMITVEAAAAASTESKPAPAPEKESAPEQDAAPAKRARRGPGEISRARAGTGRNAGRSSRAGPARSTATA